MTGGLDIKRTALTAYVLITLLEATECQEQAIVAARSQAAEYLEEHLPLILDPATSDQIVAVVAYALSLHKSEHQYDVIQVLKERAVGDSELRAYSVADLGEQASANAVETTAYAVLAFLAQDDTQFVNPMIKWLNSQQKAIGAWYSTQDTVLAIQALAEYHTKNHMSAPNMNCRLHAKDFGREYRIMEDNAAVNKRFNLTDLIGQKLVMNFEGRGVVKVQMLKTYVMAAPNDCPFELRTDSRELAPKAGKKQHEIKITVRYKGNESTMMAIVQLDLPTGFDAEHKGLNKLVKDKNGYVEQYETYKGGVTLYWKEIPRANHEVTLTVVEEHEGVKYRQPGVIQVYRYDDPEEERCEVLFSLDDTETKVKQVCRGDEETVCQCAAAATGKCYSAEVGNVIPASDMETLACQFKYKYAFVFTTTKVEDNYPEKNVSGSIKHKMKGDAQVVEGAAVLSMASGSPCPEFTTSRIYYVIGTRYLDYEENGETKRVYIVDRDAYVVQWPNKAEIKGSASHKALRNDLKAFKKKMETPCPS